MRHDLSNETTTIVAEGEELVVERVFDAPRELVWAAMTSPEHVSRWWGRLGTTTKVDELDVRPGGRWRFIAQTSNGGEAPFTGEFLEVVAPQRLVRTVIFDVEPFNSQPGAVDTITLEDLDGKTKVHSLTRFPAEEILNGAVSEGMSQGTIEQYDRLADLLAELG